MSEFSKCPPVTHSAIRDMEDTSLASLLRAGARPLPLAVNAVSATRLNSPLSVAEWDSPPQYGSEITTKVYSAKRTVPAAGTLNNSLIPLPLH